MQTFTYISICVVTTISVDFVNLLLEVLPFWNDEVIFQGFADEDDIVLNTSTKQIKILPDDVKMLLKYPFHKDICSMSNVNTFVII